MNARKSKQCGMSLSGLLTGAFLLLIVALLAMKLVPAYIHSAQIKEIMQSVTSDPGMVNAPVQDIKQAYMKRAMINDIRDITADDIEISRDDGVLKLSASYSVKIPLVANITLVLEFNPSSS